MNQKDDGGSSIDREHWPSDNLHLQGVDYDNSVDREDLDNFVMRNVVVFRSEFMLSNICGWRPHLNLGRIYQVRADAAFRPDTFTAVYSD